MRGHAKSALTVVRSDKMQKARSTGQLPPSHGGAAQADRGSYWKAKRKTNASLAKLRQYRRTGTKLSGYGELKAKITQSKQRMQLVRHKECV